MSNTTTLTHPEVGTTRTFWSETDDEATRVHSGQVVTIERESVTPEPCAPEDGPDRLWHVRASNGEQFRAWSSELYDLGPDERETIEARAEALANLWGGDPNSPESWAEALAHSTYEWLTPDVRPHAYPY